MNINVVKVAKVNPPITALPRGAFCSPPSPSPSDIGKIPMIMAKAVINAGLSWVVPAKRLASKEDFLQGVRG